MKGRASLSSPLKEWGEMLGWFVAWLLLFTSLEITAGGGPQWPTARKHKQLYQQSTSQKTRENKAGRKTSPQLPPTQQEHTGRQFCCQQNSLWQFRELFSSDICHWSSPLLSSFHYLFLKQCHWRHKLHLPQCTLFSSLATSTLQSDTLHWRCYSRWHRPGVSL